MQVFEGHLLFQRLAATATIILTAWNLIAHTLQNGALSSLESDSGGETAAMQQNSRSDGELLQRSGSIDDDQLTLAVRGVVREQALRRAADSQARLRQALQQELALDGQTAGATATIIRDHRLRRELGRRLLIGRPGGDRMKHGALEIGALQHRLQQLLGTEDTRRVLAWLRG